MVKLVVLASLILPSLSFWGLWDMYLSGALYSGNTEVGVIRINVDVIEKLPLKAKESVFETKGEKILPLFEWSVNELNVPVYPEQRVFKEITRKICNLSNNKDKLTLIIKTRPAILNGRFGIEQIKCDQIEE